MTSVLTKQKGGQCSPFVFHRYRQLEEDLHEDFKISVTNRILRPIKKHIG